MLRTTRRAPGTRISRGGNDLGVAVADFGVTWGVLGVAYRVFWGPRCSLVGALVLSERHHGYSVPHGAPWGTTGAIVEGTWESMRRLWDPWPGDSLG